MSTEFVTRYVKWCADNGVAAKPTEGSTDGQPMGGYEREPLLIWTDEDREPLRQSVKLLEMAETPIAGLEEVQAYYSVPVKLKVKWKPAPAAVPVKPKSPVGPPRPDGPEGTYLHLGMEQVGSTYSDATGDYVVEADGMFSRYWRRVK